VGGVLYLVYIRVYIDIEISARWQANRKAAGDKGHGDLYAGCGIIAPWNILLLHIDIEKFSKSSKRKVH